LPRFAGERPFCQNTFPGHRLKNRIRKSTQQLRAGNLDIASRMPKWPFQWLSKEFSRDPATKEALRRIEEVRKSGATSLDLSKLKLSTLPEAIGQLSQLQQLYLSGNQLSTLPEAIGQLSQLQVLYLSSNRLRTLPEAIGQLSQLQKLDLSDNQLSTLPEAIGQLSQLQ
jgi:Leucine-rich repeat (LRR) protein